LREEGYGGVREERALFSCSSPVPGGRVAGSLVPAELLPPPPPPAKAVRTVPLVAAKAPAARFKTMREGETIVTTEGQSMGLSFKGDAEFKTQEGKD